jgi:hypothetical protein
MISDEQLKNWFTYHPPTEGDQVKYETIRREALHFVRLLVLNTPEGPDQTTAIRKVREAVMTANAAIATAGKF